MTIPATASQISYAGDGSSVAFPIPFIFDTAADLKVILTDSDGAPTELTSGFSITGGSGSTGTCTLNDAPAVGEMLTLFDDPNLSQTADYGDNDAFDAEAHEQALDKITRQVKRLNQRVDRSFRVADGDPLEGNDLLLPITSVRAGKFAAFDAEGAIIASESTGGADDLLRTDLAISTPANDGARLVAFRQDFTGSVPVTVSSVLAQGMCVDDFGAEGDDVTIDATDIQACFDALLDNGGNVHLRHGASYACGSTGITLTRTSSGQGTRFVLDGRGARITFASLTGSNSGLTIGADGLGTFVEGGQLVVRNLTLIGPETILPGDGDPDTDTTGLNIQFAGSVLLENVRCFRFKRAFRSKWAFPLTTFNCSGRTCWIVWESDEDSNQQTHHNLEGPGTRFFAVIKSTSTVLDDGKSNNFTFIKPWMENCKVGIVIDSGTGGSGASRFRSIAIHEPYVSSIQYDVFRFGRQYDFDHPETRGADCSEFIHDITITGGIWNPTAGAWSATSAAICFDTSQRTRSVRIDIPVVNPDNDANVIVGAPSGGYITTSAYPTLSDGRLQTRFYNDAGEVVRRENHDGGMLIGNGKATPDDISEVGLEITADGRLDLTSDAAVATRWNRLTSNGTLAVFMREGVTVGSIDVTGSATTFSTSSDRNLKNDLGPVADSAALIAAAAVRRVSFKVDPANELISMFAQDIRQIAPWAVRELPMSPPSQGFTLAVDYSKLVPILWAGLQEANARLAALEAQP